MKLSMTPVVALAVLLGASASAVGDVLLIDAIAQEPANTSAGLLRPSNGMTMDQVRTRFGDPMQTVDPVGEPPISRWVYDAFTVYFEHNLVLTSVLHR